MNHSPFDDFEVSPKKSEDGIWLDYGGYGFKVRMAGSDNKEYAKFAQRELAPYQQAIKRKTIDPVVLQKVTVKIFCHTILLNWRKTVDGVHTEGVLPSKKGKPDLEYSVENAIEVFEKLPHLFEEVYLQASDVALFREEEEIETAGK